MGATVEIGLADALRALRQELAEAMADGEGKPVRLAVESVDLEMQVTLSASAEASGGVKFWVLTAGAKAAGSTGASHTVKLQLKAETADGGRVLTANPDRLRLND
ncbi:trypco2 family protein [Kitasatospora sp. NPDC056138]|uniref:trypco2 family protein n=1 Tax=Kitasatospora sp. NPDC056138 TaxID=3345724 RepID=UPI0035E10171